MFYFFFFQIQYGADVYLPEKHHNLLKSVLNESSMEIPNAEENICNFREQYQTFS